MYTSVASSLCHSSPGNLQLIFYSEAQGNSTTDVCSARRYGVPVVCWALCEVLAMQQSCRCPRGAQPSEGHITVLTST